ncbi:MAG: MATE family efflux transporter [Planctomycetota bacterium]
MSLEEAQPQTTGTDVPVTTGPTPLAELLRIAGPTVATMAGFTIMQFVDTLMIAAYGRQNGSVLEPTAATNGGLAAFAIVCIGVGTTTIVNALASQCYGGKRFARCGRFMWQGVWFSVGYALLVLPFTFLGGPIFNAAGHSPELVALEVPYFRILLYFTVIRLLVGTVGQFLIAIDMAMWTLLAALFAIAANVLFNWLLIFGNAGFPRMGVAGAAWATNLAALVELAVLAAICLRPVVRKFGITDWKLRMPAMGRLVRIGLPSGFQFAADVWPWAIFLGVVMATFGEEAMAANLFMFRFLITSFLPAVGISIAVTALVGRYVGARDIPTAKARAWLGFKIVLAWLVIPGVLYLLFPTALMRLFTDDPEVLRLGAWLLWICVGYQFFDAMYITYAHALRGAGDTLVPALFTGGLCWGMLVGGGSLVAWLLPSWGIFGPWVIACVYGVTLGIFMVVRFHYGKWQREKPAAFVQASETPEFEVTAPADTMQSEQRQAVPALQETR